MTAFGAPILVTGGAGFIGSAVVRHLVDSVGARTVNVDALTYAGNLDSLRGLVAKDRHVFVQADIRDQDAIREVFELHRPGGVLHLAAESHVDRSIDGPRDFIETNIVGTLVMLEEARRHWESLDGAERDSFRFVHVSTDEVFGALGDTGMFTETTRYDPSSPYSASKAGSDHLVRAWHRTFGLPALITNCSNNYGAHQFPEKLIPLMILNAFEGKELPVYGDGQNVRDWLLVDDHAAGIVAALERGEPGETYLFGGDSERTNLEVVHAICDLVGEIAGDGTPKRDLISFVTDRPGHDFRYAIDASKAKAELGWSSTCTFEEGLRDTVSWYAENEWWWKRVRSGEYRGERLGLGS